MADLPPELAAPQAAPQPGQEQVGLRSTIAPLVQDPVEDFAAELMSIADELGILDDAFAPETPEDQADLLDEQANPLEFLNEQQLTILVQKFLAIPEPQRSQIEEQLRAELPPQVVKRLDAVLRFVQSRSPQQSRGPV